MSRAFAIGDIHGCTKTFRMLLEEGIKIEKTDSIYCLGDYVDRGADSKGVVDYILAMRKKGYKIRTLRGNHEEIMMESGKSKANFKHWVKNGGKATLESFGVSSYSKLKPVYKNFFNETAFYFPVGKYLLVHAGFNFAAPNFKEDKEAMLWIRNFIINKEVLGNRIIVHGHTPVKLPVNNKNSNVINIDGGCVFNNVPGYGNLAALNLKTKALILAKNVE